MTTPLGLIAVVAVAASSSNERLIQVEMRPAGDPQIAVWLEDAQGRFVDTLMVTKLTGTFGLGNRPGRPDFGGGYLWPYGRREMVLPVWAHRRNVRYPRLVFQDCREDSLGWHEPHSSEEPFYCRPLTRREMEVDTITCPTTRFSSDKGIPLEDVDRSDPLCLDLFERYPETESLYPPRNDLQQRDPSRDWSGMEMFADLNDLDAVSQPTPPSAEHYLRTWRLPAGLADGTYVLSVEVHQAHDANAHHDYDFFSDPMLGAYGVRVVGQPSIVWQVPIEVSGEDAVAYATDYVGYGSVTGQDGALQPSDGTITVGVEGTGAGRLLPIQGDAGPYQVKVQIRTSDDTCGLPVPPRSVVQTYSDWRGVDLELEMDPATPGLRYELRYALGHDSIRSEGDYTAASPGPQVESSVPSDGLAIRVDMPRDQADYTIALRAYNACGAASEFLTVNVSTERREFQSIDACFVATAAHGVDYAREVQALRRFRDEVLLPSDVGLELVEFYYYVGPPMAEAVARVPALRRLARGVLGPLARWAERPRE